MVMRLMCIVPSSLSAHLLLLLFSFVGVSNLLRMFLRVPGTRFNHSWWDALVGYWGAVCRHGPCGPISPLGPWKRWIPPDLHGFNRSVFDSLEVLNGFTKQVVVNLRDIGIRQWTRWLRDDLGSSSGLISFLLLHVLSSRTLIPSLLGFWLSLISLMLSSAGPGCLFAVGLVIPLSHQISSRILLVIFCFKSLRWVFQDHGSGFAGGSKG